MRFFSDNAALVHPKVMDAVMAANSVDSAYDGDRWSAQLNLAFSEIFERPVRCLSIATGTAANCIALSAMVRPYQGVICHEEAHIEMDEAGAPGFYTGGAKLLLTKGEGAKLTCDAISAKLSSIRADVHQVQAGALSITNATEYGLVYRANEVPALGQLAREKGLKFHMDGARFANAMASSTCSPADMTWRAGVDALSFGFVKNGGMSAEALIFFNDEMADMATYQRKQAGHLCSKGRFMAAQLLAMIDGDLWLKNARAANDAAAIIAKAASSRLLHPVQANEIFLRLTANEAAKLRHAGFDFYDWGEGGARFVTSWHHDASDVQPLADAIAAL
ncbi:threonine aldolase family protein [Sphingorhabdus arenilitoris]|uniref:Threonine aldolase family protein n=1 Tax=Sphingorhabdus arenilitoris TaxID=1490041 RepID=A0ABV8RDP2_9SPHN